MAAYAELMGKGNDPNWAGRLAMPGPLDAPMIPDLAELAEFRWDQGCFEVAHAIAARWPHLRAEQGFYVHPDRGPGDHGWNVAPDGTIVDMTAAQHDYAGPDDEPDEEPEVMAAPQHPEIIAAGDLLQRRYVPWRDERRAQLIARDLGQDRTPSILATGEARAPGLAHDADRLIAAVQGAEPDRRLGIQELAPGLRYLPAKPNEASCREHPVPLIEVGPKLWALTPAQRAGVIRHEVGHFLDSVLLTDPHSWVWDEAAWQDADGVVLHGIPGERIADAYAALGSADELRWPAIARIRQEAARHGFPVPDPPQH